MRPRDDQRQSAARTAASEGLAGISVMGVGAALGAVLMSGSASFAGGLVCEHHAGLAVLHCPGCYVALAMVAGGLGLLVDALIAANRPALRLSPAKFTARKPRR